MRRHFVIPTMGLVLSGMALAQSPWIYPRGVTNAASGMPPGLAASPAAPSSASTEPTSAPALA